MIYLIDFVLGLSYGDEGKGAVTHSLASKEDYNLVMRCQGGSNAGHTIYHHDMKIVTHIIPCGILHGKISLIGSGCYINEKKFHEEIDNLKKLGFDTSLVKIASNAHVVTDDHITEEADEKKIGTTKQGIGPCARDKYLRKGIRADNVESLKPYIVDLYDFLYSNKSEWRILVEGAQGYMLDIDHGDYPYVTSSHTTLAGCLLNMLPYNKIRKVYGCIKAYETYVGSKKFQPDDSIFDEIAELGKEYGSTTGRKRQCNWINIPLLRKALIINGVTDLVISKMDILEKINEKYDNKYWRMILDNNKVYTTTSKLLFTLMIQGMVSSNRLNNYGNNLVNRDKKRPLESTSFTIHTRSSEKDQIK